MSEVPKWIFISNLFGNKDQKYKRILSSNQSIDPKTAFEIGEEAQSDIFLVKWTKQGQLKFFFVRCKEKY
jgi:hypothetical protein